MLRISVASTPSRASARRPRAPLLGGAEIALDLAESLFEERLAAGDLDVLDRAEALLQQVQLLLIQLALGFADALPRPARHHDRHQHEREHDADGDQRDRRRRDDQHRGERGDDHRFGQDVDRRSRRRARRRCPTRAPSARSAMPIAAWRGTGSRRQGIARAGAPRRRPTIDRRCPAAAIPPTTETPRAARRRRRRPAPATATSARGSLAGHIAHSRDTTGAVRTCSGSTTRRSSPNTASAPAASISAARPRDRHEQQPPPALARRQPPDHRS